MTDLGHFRSRLLYSCLKLAQIAALSLHNAVNYTKQTAKNIWKMVEFCCSTIPMRIYFFQRQDNPIQPKGEQKMRNAASKTASKKRSRQPRIDPRKAAALKAWETRRANAA